MTLDCFIFSIFVFLHKLRSSAIKGHFCSILVSNIILCTSLSSDSAFGCPPLLCVFSFFFHDLFGPSICGKRFFSALAVVRKAWALLFSLAIAFAVETSFCRPSLPWRPFRLAFGLPFLLSGYIIIPSARFFKPAISTNILYEFYTFYRIFCFPLDSIAIF